MNVKNFEFKAKVASLDRYEKKLLELNPDYKGLDHQIDTYFNVPHGRLKLREGNIENALINYDRDDIAGSKKSKVILYRYIPDPALKQILSHQFGVKIVVDKKRKIYFLENVKFHFDLVSGLGTFIEVEAIDNSGTISEEKLKEQCDFYFTYFGLGQEEIIDKSYSDLLIEKEKQTN